MKIERLPVDSCLTFSRTTSLITLISPRQTRRNIKVNTDRKIRQQRIERQPVRLQNGIKAKPPRFTLVSQRGIRKTVTHHDLATPEGRNNDFSRRLSARSKHQQ